MALCQPALNAYTLHNLLYRFRDSLDSLIPLVQKLDYRDFYIAILVKNSPYLLVCKAQSYLYTPELWQPIINARNN